MFLYYIVNEQFVIIKEMFWRYEKFPNIRRDELFEI